MNKTKNLKKTSPWSSFKEYTPTIENTQELTDF